MPTTTFDVFYILQLESEKVIKNSTEWTLNQYYANYSSFFNTTDVPLPNVHPADVIRGPCWETAVGIVSNVPELWLHPDTSRLQHDWVGSLDRL